jgi:uncharacterized protein YlxW (UPF0749 family)
MTAPPDPPRPDSVRLLVDLVNEHLDPGYAEAAARRGSRTDPRWYDRLAVAVGCALVGLLLVVAYIHTHRGAPQAEKVHDSLVERVRGAQHAGDDLAARVSALQRELSHAQARVLPQSGDLAKELDLAQLEAGLTAVSGPGVTVTLEEPSNATASSSAGPGGGTPVGPANILTDRDVRSVVNELWQDGAEAIAVNGVRLTPTSAVRFAGEAVLVDFQPVTPPYHIDAIGNADLLATNFAQSPVASRYQTLAGVVGIGFSFTDSSRLTLPASTPVRVRYATVPSRPKRHHR